jgi:preprotein translocase subunit SecE
MKKILDFFKGVRGFGRESWAELKKVTWPTRKQVGYSTAVVIGLTVLVGAYLFVVDTVLNTVFQWLLS